jgi:hypothetical protein
VISRRWPASILLLALLGCGIPLDDSPRIVQDAAVGGEGENAETVFGPANTFLYFTHEQSVVSVIRGVEERTPENLVRALLAGARATEKDIGLGTALPASLSLRSITATGPTVIVDFSQEFDDIVGSVRVQAVAQVVLTLDELEAVDTVGFTVEGQPILVTSPETGDVDRVGACDFTSLLAGDDQLKNLDLGTASETHAVTMRSELLTRCPNSRQSS